MTESQTFIIAARTMNKVVAQIKGDQWGMELPEWFQYNARHGQQNLRDIINYHAYDDAWIPAMLEGKTMAEVPGGPDITQDMLGDNPKGSFAAGVDKAVAAAQALADPGRTVHCSFGDFTAQEFLWQANSFRGLRANQVARLIGIDETLPDELVQALWDQLLPHVEEWRTMGIFRAEITVPHDAPLQQRLLAKFGYQPLPA